MGNLTAEALRTLTAQGPQDDSTADWPALCCVSAPEDHLGRPLLVVAVVAVVGGLLTLRRLPAAYRTPAFDGRSLWPKVESILLVAVYIATLASVAYVTTQALVGSDPIQFVFPRLNVPSLWLGQLTLLGIVATAVYGYRLYRFLAVKYMLQPGRPQEIDYKAYASDTSGSDDA